MVVSHWGCPSHMEQQRLGLAVRKPTVHSKALG